MTKFTHFTYPASIDFDALVEKPHEKEKLKIVLTVLVNSYKCQQKNKIYLSSRKLSKLITNNYCHYIRILIDAGIIEKSKGYKVGSNVNAYAFCDWTMLDDLVEEIAPKKYQPCFDKRNGYGIIGAYVRDLDIDYEAAMNIVHQLKGHKKRSSRIAVKKIVNKIHFSTIDNNGRLHNNLTNLSRGIRKHLTYREEQLVGIDMSNTQPLILHLLCTHPKILREYLKKSLINADIEGFMASLGTVKCEINRFGRLVLNGGLYEYIFNQLSQYERELLQLPSVTWNSLEKNKRKYVKKKVLAWINERLESKEPAIMIIDCIMAYQFPHINWLNKIVKSVPYLDFKTHKPSLGKNGEPENHKNMSRLLQTFESDLIIKGICYNFHREHQVPIFTIHDCIKTTPKHIDELEQFAKQYMIKNFGVSGHWKRE